LTLYFGKREEGKESQKALKTGKKRKRGSGQRSVQIATNKFAGGRLGGGVEREKRGPRSGKKSKIGRTIIGHPKKEGSSQRQSEEKKAEVRHNKEWGKMKIKDEIRSKGYQRK